ncbi:hypothetical protein AD428_12460, partial [Achromobacter sp. DMS1]
VVPLASGQASRMIEQAEGYKAKVVGDAQGNTSRFTSILAEYQKAPQVMRERMYLESMQEIFTRASKVMVDSKSNNNMLYLPLDKIMHQAAQDASRPGAAGSSSSGASAAADAQRGRASPSSGSSPSNTLPRDRTSR